jgi:hypothetical protein
MSDGNALAPKTEAGLSTDVKMPAGLDGAGTRDFLMPRYKIWHPMSKTEVMNAKLGLFYEANGATLAGDTIRFYLLSQVNKQFENDGVTKNSKQLLIVKDGQLEFPSEVVISGSGLRAVSGLNTALLGKSLADKNPNAFSYLIECKIEVKENDKGKFGVPKFAIVGQADAETFEKIAKLHAEHAASYATGPAGVDTATAYKEEDMPM